MFGLFLFTPLQHQAARSWNAVRHACLFCQAVQPGVVYVAPSAPCAHATTQFDSSAANVGQGACGVRLGARGLMRLSVFFGLFFFISRVRRSPVTPVERTGGATRQQSQLPTAAPVHPVQPCELDYDTCPDIMSSQICQYEGTTKPV